MVVEAEGGLIASRRASRGEVELRGTITVRPAMSIELETLISILHTV